MTHWTIQLAVTSWCLRQRWCAAAAPEVEFAGGRVDVLAVSDLAGLAVCPEHGRMAKAQREAAEADRRAESVRWRSLSEDEQEAEYRARVHVPGALRAHIAAQRAERHDPATVPAIDRKGKPKVVIVEVKATTSDLAADRKLETYGAWATACYLAGPADVLEVAREKVPTTWGLLLVRQRYAGHSHLDASVVRRPTELRACSPAMLHAATRKVAKSLSWRALKAEYTVQADIAERNLRRTMPALPMPEVLREDGLRHPDDWIPDCAVEP